MIRIKLERKEFDKEGFKIHYRNETTILNKKNKALQGENVGKHVVSSNKVDYTEWNEEINHTNDYNDFHNNQRRAQARENKASASGQLMGDRVNIGWDTENAVEKKRMSRRQRQKRNKLNK